MNKAQAILEIVSILSGFFRVVSADKSYLRSLSQGKLYEFLVLAYVTRDLRRRGFGVWPSQRNIHFKQAPGKLHINDPHFVVRSRQGPELLLFVDIEFQTLGRSRRPHIDLSCFHELDLVLVQDATDGSNPTYDQVLLAVECKSNAVLKKSFVREALGLRRELSYLTHHTPSYLSRLSHAKSVWVPAYPASEFLFVFAHCRGTKYQQGPAAFGIEFKHIKP